MNHAAICAAVLEHTHNAYGLTIRKKASSAFMKLIYVLSFMWVWNRRFMTGFWTTIAGTCWAPGDFNPGAWQGVPLQTLALVKENITGGDGAPDIEPRDWEIIAHEGKHNDQTRRYGKVRFALMYLFPQCLALLTIPLGVVVGIKVPLDLAASIALGAVIAVLPLAPWPAPWRARFEREAYTMSAVALAMKAGGVGYLGDTRLRPMYAAKFGQAYYMMVWGNQRRLAVADRILAEARHALTFYGAAYGESGYRGSFVVDQGAPDAYLLDLISVVRKADQP